MLTYVAVFHSFSLMYSIPFLVHTIFYLSIFLVINIFVSRFFFLIIECLQIFLHMVSHINIYLSPRNVTRDGSARSRHMHSFSFIRTCQFVSQSDYTRLHAQLQISCCSYVADFLICANPIRIKWYFMLILFADV